MRDAAGEFDDLLAATDLTQGVGDDLAVLAGDDLGKFLLARVEQFADVEQDLGALGQRLSRQAGNAAVAASMTARASSALPRATRAVTSPVAGFVTGAVALEAPAKSLPSHQCCTVSVIEN